MGVPTAFPARPEPPVGISASIRTSAGLRMHPDDDPAHAFCDSEAF